MPYKNTQIGYVILVALFGVILLYGALLLAIGAEPIVLGTMGVVVVVILLFSSLTVSLDSHFLRISYSIGLVRKKFPLKEIQSVKVVRNKWYFGWGIRYWPWPKMVIFNVSGLDAIEIRMKNGKRYRIGTSEPKKLESVLLSAIKK